MTLCEEHLALHSNKATFFHIHPTLTPIDIGLKIQPAQQKKKVGISKLIILQLS